MPRKRFYSEDALASKEFARAKNQADDERTPPCAIPGFTYFANYRRSSVFSDWALSSLADSRFGTGFRLISSG